MTKREALARAIAAAQLLDPDKTWKGWLPHVDAILAELREPDDAMECAGYDCEFCHTGGEMVSVNPVLIWRAMIDAIK